MTLALGSEERPLRVAIVGSGPSAFYAAEALFRTDNLSVRVDMFDRLPTPFGLVRGGVAPDHQKIKTVVRVYEGIARNEHFRFFGNVMLGRDLSVDDLRAHYDQIVYAVGCESAQRLGVPGEDNHGVHSATAFVFWYNGHPDYRGLQFELERARRIAIVGNGNVAMDVCRILIQDPERLVETDIADYALAALRRSNVREVLLLGRRGPAQAAFSPKEMQEIAAMSEVDVVVSQRDTEIDPATATWLEQAAPKPAHKNLEFLTEQSQKGEGHNERKVRCMFLTSPIEVLSRDDRVVGVRLERGELSLDGSGTPRPRGTGEVHDEPIDLLFLAIGYRGTPIAGVPFDDGWGTIPNAQGRVTTARNGEVVADQYVVGWAKRGPSGLIGTNSADSKATVARMIEDINGRSAPQLDQADRDRIEALLRQRGVSFVSFADWQRLDAYEQEQGQASGRVRKKLTSIDEMLSILQQGQ